MGGQDTRGGRDAPADQTTLGNQTTLVVGAPSDNAPVPPPAISARTSNGSYCVAEAGQWGGVVLHLVAPGGPVAIYAASKPGPRQKAHIARLTACPGPGGLYWSLAWPDDSCPVVGLPGKDVEFFVTVSGGYLS